jgi:pSer/pThr/pTyr-binding forkhead associated (FHA) protein
MPPGTSTCPRCSPGGGKRPIAKTRVYGEAAPTGVSEGWLQVIHGVDRGLKIQFTQAGLSIGRGSNNVFVINDPGSSTNHAQLVNKDGSLLLLDLGSANGTYVNEQRVTTPIPLSYGDIIRINHTRIQVLDPQFQAPPKPA